MFKEITDARKVKLPSIVQRGSRRASGQSLRRLLSDYGITPTGIAEFLGVSPACVNNWFVRGIPQQRTETIARLLSVNADWLSTGKGFDQRISLLRKPVDRRQKRCSIRGPL